MANAFGTLSAPVAQSAALYQRIAGLMKTGTDLPTFSTPPAYRAGTTATNFSNTSVATGTIAISSSVQVGDLMVLVINGTAISTTLPAGWSNAGATASGVGNLNLLYKFAAVGDINTTLTFTFNSNSVYAAAFAAYSGVWPECPFNAGVQSTNTVTPANNACTLPTCTTVNDNVLVLQLFYSLASTSGQGAVTGPNTVRVTANGNVNGATISELAVPTAGATGTATATVPATFTAFWASFMVGLNGVPTVVSAPAGGWQIVEAFTSFATATHYIWKSPGGSNHAGVDLYLDIRAQMPGYNNGTAFSLAAFEQYNTSTRIKNCCLTSWGNTGSSGITVSGASSPPWGAIATSPATVLSANSGEQTPGGSVSVGTNQYLVAANADGFYLANFAGGSISHNYYIGAFTSLVTNAALTDGGFTLVDFTGSGGAYTRDPGQTLGQPYWGQQNRTQYWVGLTFQGIVNGSSNNNDLYQSVASTPISARWMLNKSGASSSPSNVGNLRGLIPSWMQSIPQSGCVFGDTVTQLPSADTLTYTLGQGASLWIDSTVA